MQRNPLDALITLNTSATMVTTIETKASMRTPDTDPQSTSLPSLPGFNLVPWEPRATDGQARSWPRVSIPFKMSPELIEQIERWISYDLDNGVMLMRERGSDGASPHWYVELVAGGLAMNGVSGDDPAELVKNEVEGSFQWDRKHDFIEEHGQNAWDALTDAKRREIVEMIREA